MKATLLIRPPGALSLQREAILPLLNHAEEESQGDKHRLAETRAENDPKQRPLDERTLRERWRAVRREDRRCKCACAVMCILAIIGAGIYVWGYMVEQEELDSVVQVECEAEVWCMLKKCCAVDGEWTCLATEMEYGVTWTTRLPNLLPRTLSLRTICAAEEKTEWCNEEWIIRWEKQYNGTVCYGIAGQELYVNLEELQLVMERDRTVAYVLFGLACFCLFCVVPCLYQRRKFAKARLQTHVSFRWIK